MDRLTRAVVTSGTGRSAGRVPNAHGKTGTTEEYTDAWFVGYTPELVTAVWCGNRDNSHMGRVYGGDISAPIWANFMAKAVKLNPDRDPATIAAEKEARAKRRLAKNSDSKANEDTEGKVRTRICVASGMRAGRACPDTRREYFAADSRPAYCTMHRRRREVRRRRERRRNRDADAPTSTPTTTDSPGVEAPAAATDGQ
jgi:membrane peptidoglycan carboxypeptidase